MPELHFEYCSEVKQRKVEQLWYPYIPYGKITILQGDPGEGKSTFILNIAAKYRCAVVLVGHLNKAYCGKNLYRGLGSIDK